jgi:omega-6 fatty acid desaturase (delta-12 desaturase)
MHHAGSGNLNKRGVGDIDVLTVREYQKLSPVGKLHYRIMRNPVFLLCIGGPLYFIVLNRFPWLRGVPVRQAWRNMLGLDAALLAAYGTLSLVVGWKIVALTILPGLYVAIVIGVYLFYVQHQFEHTMWESDKTWDFQVAAIYGSSYFELPRVLAWFTGDIGIHHVHHLMSRVPNYRLRECLAALPELQTLNHLTFRDTLQTFHGKLWDEDKRLLVGFP